jgi:pyruvate dehydrogenase (quinone)/pyruvate oxidase
MAETAADVIVQTLLNWGVSVIYGVPGDGVAGLLESLRKRHEDVEFVQTRSELAAAFAAVGFAKFTGRLGVCLATAGPGGLGLLTGLYDAKFDGAPVLAVTGMQHHDLIGTGAQQDVALDRVFADAAVYSERVMSPLHAETVCELACRHALARHGPAHVTVPVDIQTSTLSRALRGRSTARPVQRFDTMAAQPPDPVQVERAAGVLNRGRRVCILAGRGALGARSEVEAVADALGAPVVETLLGLGTLPYDSPYLAGTHGLIGTRPAQDAVEGCDTLLILGSTFPYLEYYPRPGQARIVQVDADASRIGLRVPAEAGVAGDVAAALRALQPLLERGEDRLFLEMTQAAASEWQDELEKQATRGDTPMKPQLALRELDRVLPDDALVAVDNGATTTWAARFLRARGSMRFAWPGTLAPAGCALPYAIGAATAHPGRRSVCITGDGALTPQIGELATLARYGMDLKVLVLKNNLLAQLRWEQLIQLGHQEYATELHPVDFAAVAQGFGVASFAIERPEDCADAMAEAMATAGPVLIEAFVDPFEPPLPPKATLTQAAQLAEALARGAAGKRRIALTLASDTVRQLI